MRIIKQKTSLNIENNDLVREDCVKHSLLFPSTMRCLVIGPSNCGKTNVIISLIEHPNGLKFKNIYVYSKSLYQSKYVYVKSSLYFFLVIFNLYFGTFEFGARDM
jgi:hypothetical protein